MVNKIFYLVQHASLIRFPENSLRPLGRTASECERYFSKRNDVVVGLDVAYAESEDEVLVVTEKGYGKRTPVSEYRLSNRGGKGIKQLKLQNVMVMLYVLQR